jgi:hypothetical protein
MISLPGRTPPTSSAAFHLDFIGSSTPLRTSNMNKEVDISICTQYVKLHKTPKNNGNNFKSQTNEN